MTGEHAPEPATPETGTGKIFNPPLRDAAHVEFAKVPAVTLGFWLIKILATTLGETAGDAVTMSMNLGYLAGTAIFAVLLAIGLVAQIRANRFHPMLFWVVIVATTTVGTTLADLCDRSLGIGYLGGSALLFASLAGTLFVWYRQLGSVSIKRLDTRKAEFFYWLTILFSQTLGTALGDWVADPTTGWGFGYGGGAILFASALAIVVGLYFLTQVSRTALFWAAFILTRPLGATVGDFLDKPVASGGLAMSRYTASAALVIGMLVLVFLLPQRAERIEAASAD
jgi:uncharacterized membrane-anchored protein